MNLDAFSDLALFLVCAVIAFQQRQSRPGVAIAIGLIGLAALLGVFRFLGVSAMVQPHQLASLFSACAAFPLLACSLNWANGSVAQRFHQAALFALLVGGAGMAITMLAFKSWAQVAPLVALILIFLAAIRSRSIWMILGALLLAASFAANVAIPADAMIAGVLSRVQIFHYLLAAALATLTWMPGGTVPRQS